MPRSLSPMLDWTRFETPDYSLSVTASDAGIRTIDLHGAEPSGRQCGDNPFLKQALSQLGSYFAGELHDFELTLDMQGTGFQKRVWDELQLIPYGETRSYSQVANAIGAPKA